MEEGLNGLLLHGVDHVRSFYRLSRRFREMNKDGRWYAIKAGGGTGCEFKGICGNTLSLP